jgi:hypothetical protein
MVSVQGTSLEDTLYDSTEKRLLLAQLRAGMI